MRKYFFVLLSESHRVCSLKGLVEHHADVVMKVACLRNLAQVGTNSEDEPREFVYSI